MITTKGTFFLRCECFFLGGRGLFVFFVLCFVWRFFLCYAAVVF